VDVSSLLHRGERHVAFAAVGLFIGHIVPMDGEVFSPAFQFRAFEVVRDGFFHAHTMRPIRPRPLGTILPQSSWPAAPFPNGDRSLLCLRWERLALVGDPSGSKCAFFTARGGSLCFPDLLAQSFQFAKLSKQIGRCVADGCNPFLTRNHLNHLTL
jgi:hypothetical protein